MKYEATMGSEASQVDPAQDTAPIAKRQKRFWKFYFPRIYGLQGKLIIPYVILTLLLALTGTYVITRLVASSGRERFINTLVEANKTSNESVVRQEELNLQNLRLLSNFQGVPQAIAEQDLITLETLILPAAINAKVDIVSILDQNGNELVTYGFDPSAQNYVQTKDAEFSSYEFVQNALLGKVDELGDKYAGMVNTQYGWAMLTITPIKDANGKVVGAMMVGTRLNTLLSAIKLESFADPVILDLDKKFLASTLPRPEEGYQVLEQAANSATLEGDLKENEVILNNRDFLAIYTPFIIRQQNLGWLGVVMPNDYVTTTESTSRLLFSILFTMATVAIILVGYVISQSIARPILKLRSASQAVASGDLDQRIGLKQSDEIGELAGAFDQMTTHLRERTNEASRLYDESQQRNKELAEINAKLQSTQLQLTQSEKLAAIGQLTAGIVHDVKNPLTVIKGMAELMLEQTDIPDDTQQGLSLIRESAIKANRIVTDLLKFARQSSPEMAVHDLRETVEASLRLTAYLTREARVKVTHSLPEEPVMVTYDPQQIEQVFINMITNATQAMPNAGTLHISMWYDGEWAAVEFRDTGIGMAPEIKKRIFDPFFTTKPEGQGTGLGLSVSYGIIANHNGKIDVESEVDKGTTFTIVLPLEQNVPEVSAIVQ